MSIVANRTRLESSTQQLLAQWRQTKEYWQDAKASEFERKYLDELISGVNVAVAAMEELEKLASKVRTDCE
jgi:hypothetical protein